MDGLDWSVALGLPAIALIAVAARPLIGRTFALTLAALAPIAGLAWLGRAHLGDAAAMVLWSRIPFTAMLIPLGEVLVVLSLVVLYVRRRY